MFKKIRTLFKHSVVYGMGTIAARAVAFVLLPYYSHLWTPSEYAVYTLFMILVAFLQPLFIHGMDIAFLRFSASSNHSQQKSDLGFILTHTTIIGIFLGFPIYLFAPDIARLVVSAPSPDEILLTQLTAAILLIDTLSNQIFTYLRIKNRPAVFSSFKLANVVVNIALNIYFVGSLKLGVVGSFYAFLITAALTLLALLVLVIRDIKPNWNPETRKTWLTFGLPNVPAMLFVMIIGYSDRKWLEYYVGLEDAGLYSAGYRVGMLMLMLVQAFRYAWQPFFLQTSGDSDAKETFARVMTYFVAVTGWIWLGSALLLEDILKISIPGMGPLIDVSYWKGLAVIPVVMFGHIFAGIHSNFAVGVYIEKKTKIIPVIVGIAALVNILANWILVRHYGYWASAWIMVFSNALMAVLMYFYINPKYPITYEWNRIIRLSLTIFAAWGFSSAINDAFSLEGAVFWLFNAGIVILTPLSWWLYVLSGEERNGLKRYLRSKR
ncbi:polysaccharide biosynthesis C-terminal domain-containing protein [Calditrichota bacterium]